MASKQAAKAKVSAETAADEPKEAEPKDLHDEAGLPEHGVVDASTSHEDSAVVRMAAKEHAGAVADAESAKQASKLAEEGASHREKWTEVQLENAKDAAVEAANPVKGPKSEAEALAEQEKEVAERLKKVDDDETGQQEKPVKSDKDK